MARWEIFEHVFNSRKYEYSFFIFGYLFIEGGFLEDASCERDSGEEIGGHGYRYQAVVMGVSEEWERGDGGEWG